MLQIKYAKKIFDRGTPNEQIALDDLNLTLSPGEFVTIIGSNGAGKSTLFNAICGNFWLDAGHIILDGRDITYEKEYLRASEIGRLFQDPMRGSAPHMTIEENLALVYSKANRRPLSPALRKKDRDVFCELLSRLDMGLEDRMKTRMGLLSGGQRQAVTLIMSTMITPKLLLLDEHTAALDPITAEKVLAITKSIITEKNLTAMMITHNINSALELGTRTLMLEDGRIVLDLTGEERKAMTVTGLIELYRQKCSREFDTDRVLLTK
ncbi:ABC transporter ATP-binding protein [Anaerolentibacter hominis]|uniref:ABC transporter ATP-binding protein n=1 Tax=Anaerolentibacter hominis TaxID=3079009 RepID=UPI0031B89985